MKVQSQHFERGPQRTTVVGVFDDNHLAGQAISELSNVGFRENQICVSFRDGQEVRDQPDKTSSAHAGAFRLTGFVPGDLAGERLVAGIMALVDPVGAAGASGAVLSNPPTAEIGIAGLIGVLAGAGVPEHEARYYRDEFEAGRTIITVTAGSRGREAKAILRRHGSYDMNSGILSREGK